MPRDLNPSRRRRAARSARRLAQAQPVTVRPSSQAVAAMIARTRINSLGVETDDSTKHEVLGLLRAKWSRSFGLDHAITAKDAAALLAFLGDELEEGDLRDDLNDRINDQSDQGSQTTEEVVADWDDDDFALESQPSFSTPVRQPVDKVDVGKRFAKVMRELDAPVFLAGGGAATMLGSMRAIKDLDFRIELEFKWDDELGQALIDQIDDRMGAEFDRAVAFTVSDAGTAYTIKGSIGGVEVSVTRTPRVAYFAHGATATYPGKPAQEVPTVGEFDLILDKSYSFIMRTDEAKQMSDLFDLLFALRNAGGGFDAGCRLLRFLNLRRGDAYQHQRSRRVQRDDDMLTQLKEAVSELLETSSAALQRFFSDSGDVTLFELAPDLVAAIDDIAANPTRVDVL